MTQPRVLIYDIETAPNLGYVWGKWRQNVVHFQSEWYILCFAYKWLDERSTRVVALPDFDLYQTEPDNDRLLVGALRDLLDEADVTIAHNVTGFDAPRARSRMLAHGIDPPSPSKDIDTLRVARRQFAFNGNRLDDLCRALGVGVKAETGGFGTWLGCMSGDPKAWKQMTRYNRQDVVILEELYRRLRPWIPNHPNMALIAGRPDSCPRCGASEGFEARGWRYYNVTRRRRFRCRACRGYVMGRHLERTDVAKVSA